MLTRDFRPLEERTRYPLKPLFSHFFLPAPFAIARLDIRLRRAALYPAELRVLTFAYVTDPPDAFNGAWFTSRHPHGMHRFASRSPLVRTLGWRIVLAIFVLSFDFQDQSIVSKDCLLLRA